MPGQPLMVCPLMTITKIPKPWSTAIQQGVQVEAKLHLKGWATHANAFFGPLSTRFLMCPHCLCLASVTGTWGRIHWSSAAEQWLEMCLHRGRFPTESGAPAAETHSHWLIHPDAALETSHRTTSPTLQSGNSPWSLQDSNPKTFRMQSINPAGLVPLTETCSHLSLCLVLYKMLKGSPIFALKGRYINVKWVVKKNLVYRILGYM